MRNIKGQIIIISGPSRIGKDVIVKKVSQNRQLKLSNIITYTTRPKRDGEKNRREHIFVTDKIFKKLITNSKLLEWKLYSGYKYGTPKDETIKKLNQGKNVLLNLEVRGCFKIKKQFPSTITIFITAESTKEVKRRILESNKLTARQKIKRWQTAIRELKVSKRYDYIVVNGWNKLNQAIKEVTKIIKENIE